MMISHSSLISPHTTAMVCEKKEVNWPRKILVGEQCRPHIQELAELYRAYREWPFVYEAEISDNITHITNKYASDPNSVTIIISDDSKIIGAIMGIPFKEEKCKKYKPAFPNGQLPENTFYIGDCFVNPQYQRKGVAQSLYRQLETLFKGTTEFNKVVVATLAGSTEQFRSDNHIWEKMCFHKNGGQYPSSWKHINESSSTVHQMDMWIKEI